MRVFVQKDTADLGYVLVAEPTEEQLLKCAMIDAADTGGGRFYTYLDGIGFRAMRGGYYLALPHEEQGNE